METSVVEQIEEELEKIQDWDVENFPFDPPVSKFTDELLRLNIQQIFAEPNHQECLELARDSEGKPIKLSKEQLVQLRTEAIIRVASKLFPGKYHVWRVSPLLQSGKKNLLDYLLNGLAAVFQRIRINMVEAIIHGKYFSIVGGMANIIDGLWSILSILFGQKTMIGMYADYEIKRKMEQYVRSKILEAFQGKEQTTIDQYRDMVDKLVEPFGLLKESWQINQASRRRALLQEYQSRGYKGEELFQRVFDDEAKQMKEEMFQLIKKNLSPQEAEKLINLIKSVQTLRDAMAKYYRCYRSSMNIRSIVLTKNYPIASRSSLWMEKQLDAYEKKWQLDNTGEDSLRRLAGKLKGQEKLIFQENLNIVYSVGYQELKIKLENNKIPTDRHIFRFHHGDPRKWYLDQDKIVVTDTIVTNGSSYFGWRIGNLVLRTAQYFQNGCNFLWNNFWNGSFGIKSWSFHNYFVSGYVMGSDARLNPINRITWMGRISALWKNISDSRKRFETNDQHGIMGKGFTRIFHVVWNYLVKGVAGTALVVVGHPILTIFHCTLSIIGLVTAPIWSVAFALLVYFWNVLVYDSDTIGSLRWFPLIRTILEKIIVRGIGQSALAVFAVAYHSIMAAVILVWTLLSTGTKYGYDSIMYHLILKMYAKVPAVDDFLAKRIEGPGLSSNYFYLLEYQVALVLLQHHLEQLEMDEYLKKMILLIDSKYEALIQCLKKFSAVGLEINIYHERIQRFANTRNELHKRLREIEKNHWNKHPIKGTIFKKIIKMDRENLIKAIAYGAKLCEQFFSTYIFPKQNAEEREDFWIGRNLKQNDWRGLSIYCYKTIFGESIIVPLEETEEKGFPLVVSNDNVNSLVKSLFNGHWDDQLKTKPHISIMKIPENIKPTKKLVTLDNLFHTEEYENALYIYQPNEQSFDDVHQ